MHMEVDIHSPPYKGTRSYSTKRPRSPDDSIVSERHSKRLSLAIGNARLPQTRTSHNGVITQTSDSTLRPSPEDWVRQTRGLTIDSPLAVTEFPFSCQSVNQDAIDDNMTLDYDEGTHIRSPPLPTPKPSPPRNVPFIQISTTSSTQYPPQQLYQVSRQSHHQTPSLGSDHHHPPMIYLHPATPSDTPSLQSSLQFGAESHLHTRQISPISSSMSGTSPTSPQPNSPISSGRKQRFTMGPRADCIKCRTGVKGHWMHV
ncbi:hypothetical protein SERLADRAFT_475508, partial [Serpula lacrymans var. lacrymans S7.9]